MANLITVARTLLAFLAVAMLRWHTWEIYVGAAILTLLLIWMDAWDGWVARRRNEASKAGAVFDILGDRVVEMTYWIAFASFGWIPVWVAVLEARRTAAAGQLAERVAALEGIRLDLLRLHAGASDLAPLTTLIDAARVVGEDVRRLADAQREADDAAGRHASGVERDPTPA